MRKIITLIMLTLFMLSCKKNRTCECKNSNGTYDAGDVEATKMRAKKYCEDLSDGQTQCYLKGS